MRNNDEIMSDSDDELVMYEPDLADMLNDLRKIDKPELNSIECALDAYWNHMTEEQESIIDYLLSPDLTVIPGEKIQDSARLVALQFCVQYILNQQGDEYTQTQGVFTLANDMHNRSVLLMCLQALKLKSLVVMDVASEDVFKAQVNAKNIDIVDMFNPMFTFSAGSKRARKQLFTKDYDFVCFVSGHSFDPRVAKDIQSLCLTNEIAMLAHRNALGVGAYSVISEERNCISYSYNTPLSYMHASAKSTEVVVEPVDISGLEVFLQSDDRYAKHMNKAMLGTNASQGSAILPLPPGQSELNPFVLDDGGNILNDDQGMIISQPDDNTIAASARSVTAASARSVTMFSQTQCYSEMTGDDSLSTLFDDYFNGTDLMGFGNK